ncbi:hypothetical protein [Curtobacterium sp. Leaf261]|uniref:hypothetical protein n=1 Tax=Curtobacterium sp. Leaf261 TaxID=1736311 RepID=UPI0006FEC53B|nr:hypothetical protein [Curtobacterium sp. Leaf261]KQO65209.1 hypothetical protein ASF23_03615 [Curtobacterium sp. Leaf261]
MITDNAKTPISSSSEPENAAEDFRKPNQNHDAAARSRSISQQTLTTLTEWRRADNITRRPKRTAAATPPVLQRDGRFYAPAMPRDLAVAFDATHVTRPDQINPRRYQFKRDRNEIPQGRGANRRVIRCPLRTNAL